jgi:hypothetical protein
MALRRRQSLTRLVPRELQELSLTIAQAEFRFTVDELTFYNWHKAPPWARSQLRDWVWGMRRKDDGEWGGWPGGAGPWLDKKVALSRPGGLFQTFVAVYQHEVVWTGSVVQDDRNCRIRFEAMGGRVDAFFGLFNTRRDLRGRGIGWAGANYVSRHVWRVNRDWKNICVGLFTTNPAAERHYVALGFKLIGNIYVPAAGIPIFGTYERAYIRDPEVQSSN